MSKILNYPLNGNNTGMVPNESLKETFKMAKKNYQHHSPLVFEDVQTYCPGNRAYVGMPDLCDKAHLGEGKITES